MNLAARAAVVLSVLLLVGGVTMGAMATEPKHPLTEVRTPVQRPTLEKRFAALQRRVYTLQRREALDRRNINIEHANNLLLSDVVNEQAATIGCLLDGEANMQSVRLAQDPDSGYIVPADAATPNAFLLPLLNPLCG